MLITVTGVDDHTDLDRLFSFAQAHPDMELGILYSQTRAGQGRYPSFQTIQTIIQKKFALAKLGAPVPRLAMHFCGDSVFELMNEVSAPARLAQCVDRIQLNFNAKQLGPDQLIYLQAHILRHPAQHFITQHNGNNSDFTSKLNELHEAGCLSNHSTLMDSSGGRGVLPLFWPAPFAHRCGYAGGLGPDNLQEELDEAYAIFKDPVQIEQSWVDMESSLRDEGDRFCLNRVEQTLVAFAEWREKREDIHSQVSTRRQAPAMS